MPIFEFRCKKCGHPFSKLVWNSNTESCVPCPKCESTETEKLISTFSSITQSGSSGGAGDRSGSGCGGAFT